MATTTASPKRRQRRILVPLILLVLAGIVVPVVLLGSEPGLDEPAAIRAPMAGGRVLALPGFIDAIPETAAGQSAPARTGEELIYRFATSSSVRVISTGSGPLAAALVEMNVQIQGTLVLRLYERVGTGRAVGFEARGVRSRMSAGKDRPPVEGVLARSLTGEVLAVLCDSGRLGKVVFPEGLGVEGRTAWRDILSRWVVRRPDAGDPASWETSERDPTGHFTARYERRSAPGALPEEIVKTKIRYTELQSSYRSDPKARTHIEGQTRYLLDPLPRVIEGAEKLVAEKPGLKRVIGARSAFRFVRVSRETVSAVTARAGRTARMLAAAKGSSPVAIEDPLSGLSPETARKHARELLEALNRFEGEKDEEARRNANRAVARLVRLLRTVPASVEAVRVPLLAGRLERPAAHAVCLALGAADTTETQAVLTAVLAEPRLSVADRKSALVGLVHVKTPAPFVDGALRKVHESDGEEAPLALRVLGAVGSHVRDSDPKRFGVVLAGLEESMRQARTVSERCAALGALRNLGPKEIPEVVRVALGSEHEPVRRAAVDALLRVGSAQADQALIRMACRDASAYVRRQAVEQLVRRLDEGRLKARDSLVSFLRQVAEKDLSDMVRKLAERKLEALGA